MAELYGLDPAEAARWRSHFGVTDSEIVHDFVISQALRVLAPHADRFVFYGGTALSRTFLDGLRLSEDLDLLSIGPRKDAAALLDEALRLGLEEQFGAVEGQPRLTRVKTDTQACLYSVGELAIKIQLINGEHYTPWPRQTTQVSLRYDGLEDVTLTTYTPEAFVGAKTAAWCDRNAARDLYDLWALARRGYINADAAQTFQRCGPTSGYPRPWLFPGRPPSDEAWSDALGHLCVLQVGSQEAYRSVLDSWQAAVADAESSDVEPGGEGDGRWTQRVN